MKNIRKEARTDIIDTEKTANSIMFVAWTVITVMALVFVIFFFDETRKDWTALIITVIGIVMRILEKKTTWFPQYAKYGYLTIPFWCTCVLVYTNDGKFAASTQTYFMILMVVIAYHDVKLVFYYSAITIVSTIGALIFFPEAMLKLHIIAVWLFIFMVFFMATLLAAVIAWRMKLLIEKARQVKAYEVELIYLEQLEKKERKYSELIHNISHYFVAIGELARTENCEQIAGLVQELNGKVLHNERIIYTSHKVLNAILSEKAGEAEEKQVKLDVYVEPGLELNGITDGDLVSMVGNLLDNALEAAGTCTDDKKKILLKIFMEKEGRVFVMKLVNYFITPPIIKKSVFVSTKKEPGQAHGIGIKSVEKTAKKYGGYLQCLIKEDKFSAILILPAKN